MSRALEGADVLLGAPVHGRLLVLDEPLSFWGGVDSATGLIIDRNHPQCGTSVSGRALMTGATRGSSSSSSTLLECVRRGTAPSLLLLTARDPILVVGAAAAWEIYGRGPAVVFVDQASDLVGEPEIQLTGDGRVVVGPWTTADKPKPPGAAK